MHVIQAFFLWLFVSGLMIGGAFAFRYFFPRESPWFGFIVPPLALVVLLNFIEHFVALPDLLPLLPVLVAFLAWTVSRSGYSKRELLLPSLIFLGSFAFTFGIRCLQPDILPSSDGLADLNKINNYCQGDMLPPIDTWLPPYKYEWYYSLQHYAASIIKRLLGIRLGVAYNISHALLSALTCVAGAAAAHRISGGKTWITAVVPFLIESAATGSSAYIQLFMHDPNSWLANNLSGAFEDLPHNNPDNPLWKLLAAPHHERLELQVPGFWTWRDEYHANASGHFLTLLSIFVIAELNVLSKSIWPWIMAALIPFLAVVASTWAYPITGLLCGGALLIAFLRGCRPDSLGLTGLVLGAGLLLLWPSLYDVTSSPEVPDLLWTQPQERAPLAEFLIQWWPVLLLWIYGCCHYRRLEPPLRWVLVVLPLMLVAIEIVTVEGRYNTVEKMWGYTYGAGLIALFPVVARRPAIPSRILTVILLLSAFVSLAGWLRNVNNWMPWGRWPSTAAFNLQGDHYMTEDDQKRRMIEVMTRLKHATFLTGKCADFNYYESPAPAVFTENRSYATWTYFESVANYRDVAEDREKQNNDFYAGAVPDPLQFLQSHHIAGVMIWPDDHLSADYLANLTRQIDPAYEYFDCKGGGTDNAGIFLLRSRPPGH